MSTGNNIVRSHSSVVRHCSFSLADEIPHCGILNSLRRLSSLPEDFCCSICMNVFRKPSMLTCGHSFCTECIQHWLSENVSCPTCRTSTRLPIRNIALEQVVEEFKLSRRCRLRNSKSSNTCGVNYSNLHALDGNIRRDRVFMDGQEIIVDGPGSSMEEVHTSIPGSSSQSLNSLPVTNCTRRVDVWKSRRMDREPLSHDSGISVDSLSKELNRISFLRRSVCAIRRSVRRHPRKKNIDGLLNATTYANANGNSRPPSNAECTREPITCDDNMKTKKFTWKKLLPFKLKKVRPARSNEKYEVPPCGSLCVYSGFGRTFERINPGEEIAIAVFGKRGVGKTSLLDNAALLCEGRHGIAPLGLTERMRLGGKQNHMEYRFAHMTSLTVQTSHQLFVIDLIDAELEDDHSATHTSYMRAADAAILLYSCSDSASLLTAMSIHRQLGTVTDSKKPCVLLANVIHGALQRYVTREMGEKTARNIRAVYVEADLLVQEGSVSKVIEYLCRAVVAARRNTDVKDICAVM